MTGWSDRAERLLYDGESIESEHPVGDATVFVTTHRVLAFAPNVDGPDYRHVDRPNVEGLERRRVPRLAMTRTAAKVGAFGAVAAALGLAIDAEAIIAPPEVESNPVASDVVGLVETIASALRALDDVLLAVGALALLAAVVAFAADYLTREDRLAIRVAGAEPDLLLPDELDPAARSDLEAALTAVPESE